jgi:hypothetical protein
MTSNAVHQSLQDSAKSPLLTPPRSIAMTTEATAAPSALSQLKIDRSTQAASKKKRNVWPLVIGGLLLAGAGGYFFMPRTVDVSTTNAVMSTPSQQYVQLTAMWWPSGVRPWPPRHPAA